MSFAGLTKSDRDLFKKQTKAKVRQSAPALLQTIDVISNENSSSTVSLISGTVRVLYYESILQDTVRASVVFSDAGNTMTRTVKTGRGQGNKSRSRKDKKKISAVEGLPIVGEEQVNLKFTDNKDNTIKFSDDNSLYVNSITALPTDSQTTTKAYELDLVSKEFINNEKERVRYCSADQISDQVKKIFKDVLKSEKIKDGDIEDTKNPIQYIGKNRKPFYVLNDLSKKAVSAGSQESGFSAGYFFFETSEGYKFKSIDTLLSQQKKKSIIYNETPDTSGTPEQYDIKALTLDTDNRINVQKKLAQGAYNIRSISINPFNTNYETKIMDAHENEKKLKLGGKGLPTQNDTFTKDGADANFSRTTYYFTTEGQQHIGETEEQLDNASKENFKKNDVVNQSIMRYNQLFASQITITIPGEFSLHAGDAVFMDIPQIGESQNKACGDEVNKEDGGLYIIADLCHYITAKETYTKLNLIRDSFGRDGNPTKGKTN